MTRSKFDFMFIVFCFASLIFVSACADGNSSDPTPDVNDTTPSTDVSPSSDTFSPQDTLVDEDTLNPQDTFVAEDTVSPQDIQSDTFEAVEDPCAVGFPPSIQMGIINQVDMAFEVLGTGDPIPFEWGPQGSDMVVLDLLHKGTAGLDFSLKVEISDVATGEDLIVYESPFPGAALDRFTGEGPEDPMWSCVSTLGNVIPNLWLESGPALQEGSEVLLKATATYNTGTDTEPMVLTFEVQGILNYNL